MLEMQRCDDQVGAANAALMLGTCLVQMGDLPRAETHLNWACDFYRRAGMFPSLVRTLSSLAQLYEIQQRTAQAHDIRAEAESLLQKLGS